MQWPATQGPTVRAAAEGLVGSYRSSGKAVKARRVLFKDALPRRFRQPRADGEHFPDDPRERAIEMGVVRAPQDVALGAELDHRRQRPLVGIERHEALLEEILTWLAPEPRHV